MKPPTPFEQVMDVVFKGLSVTVAWCSIALVALILLFITVQAWPILQKEGLRFLTTEAWNAGQGTFGIRPQIWGTVYSASLC